MQDKKKKLDELEILDQMNNMTEAEKEDFRKRNKEHDDMIAKRTVRNPISRFIKRCIDIAGGLVGCIILIPITVIAWAMNKINKEDGPVFYTQNRIGLNGEIFKIHKFRSMVVGAEEILQKYLDENPEAAEEYRKNKKLRCDPRVTKTGYYLRRTSLDEWPQFIEILTGKMSLVGPRPYLESEKEDMGEYYDYIIKVKPGLTGPWQIAGRSNLDFNDRLKLDEEYASRCGNRRDFVILLKTAKKVFEKEGAI